MALASKETVVHVIVPATKLPAEQQLVSLPADPTPGQMAAWAITTVQNGGPLAHELLTDPVTTLRAQGVVLPVGLRIQMLRNDAHVTHRFVAVKQEEQQPDGELLDEHLEAVAGGKGSSSAASETWKVTKEGLWGLY